MGVGLGHGQRRSGADGGDVISLQVEDYVGDRIDALLHREREAVVLGTYEVSHHLVRARARVRVRARVRARVRGQG